jgi:hypothetical protein
LAAFKAANGREEKRGATSPLERGYFDNASHDNPAVHLLVNAAEMQSSSEPNQV